MLDSIAADVADSNLAVLGILVDLLDQFLTTLLRQLGECQTDGLAGVGGVDAQIGLQNSLFVTAQSAGIPGSDQLGTGIG